MWGVKSPLKNEGDTMKGIKKSIECKRFEDCNAAMCPLDIEHLKIAGWYADEDICSTSRAQWVTTQKKIAKKSKEFDTYYTFEMLNRNIVVRGGITGLNPDSVEAPQLEKWLKAHPEQSKEAVKQKSEDAKKRFGKK